MKRFTTLTLAFAVSGLLAACGTAAPGASTMSVKTVARSAAAKTTPKAAAAKAPAIKLPAITAGVADGGAAPAAATAYAAAGAGAVKVAFGSLPARKLLGLDDITSARLTLTSADGATRTGSIARAALANGVGFEGVVAGAATLTVEALDAAGSVLGSSSAATTVTAGQTATVALTVKVAATAAAASTGAVNATVAFVEDPATTPAPVTAASPSPAASTLPTFLQTPAPSVAPSTSTTVDVWGRLYDYSGTQQLTGIVRYKSTDAARPFEVVVNLRDDGYYYIPAVPSGVPMEVTAWSGQLGSQAQYVFTKDATDYEWLDVFVQTW